MCEGKSGDHHHEHGHILVPENLLRQRPFTRRAALRVGVVGIGAAFVAACSNSSRSNPFADMSTSSTELATSSTTSLASSTTLTPASTPLLEGFDAFASTVNVTKDGQWWLVESDGMPAHQMMVGITSWQQQVPTPQPYTGSNAWQIPVTPKVAEHPVSARTSLYTGAIALAANGVPIFNALNNRGDDAFLYGELDKWGGHAGRADDYHYHVAPLHLQGKVGSNRPIAWALDGFPIYGETEPDGSAMKKLDEYNGHFDSSGAYHYHGTRTYPYINGGLRGVVTVSGDQVVPQPRTNPFRQWLQPLKGATVVGFESPTTGSYRLTYSVDGSTGEVAYVVSATEARFTFTAPDGVVTRETYARRP
jgi:hypothetical protein